MWVHSQKRGNVRITADTDDTIHYGMRNASPLTCFSEREKKIQYNLCQLAIVAVKFPRLRNLIVKHLIDWKPNKIFFMIHYLFAISAYGNKIFPFKHTVKEYVELISRTMKHYLYDFTKKNNDSGTPATHRKETAANHAVFPKRRSVELQKCMTEMYEGWGRKSKFSRRYAEKKADL